MDELQCQQFRAKPPVTNKIDTSIDLLNSVLVVSGEVTRDADQPRRRPVDLGCTVLAELLHGKELELGLVVEQPIEIEQPLVDDVLVRRSLVLDDDRSVVLVDAERVDAAGVRLAGGVLAGEERHAEKRLAVTLDQRLERPLDSEGHAFEFRGGLGTNAKKFDVAHAAS